MGGNVDAIIQIAAWYSASLRDYPGMNVRTDQCYGLLWDMVMAAFRHENAARLTLQGRIVDRA